MPDNPIAVFLFLKDECGRPLRVTAFVREWEARRGVFEPIFS
jgi:hypothetical protein